MFRFGAPILLYAGSGMVVCCYCTTAVPRTRAPIVPSVYSLWLYVRIHLALLVDRSKVPPPFSASSCRDEGLRATKWYHTMTFGFLSLLCRINLRTRKFCCCMICCCKACFTNSCAVSNGAHVFIFFAVMLSPLLPLHSLPENRCLCYSYTLIYAPISRTAFLVLHVQHLHTCYWTCLVCLSVLGCLQPSSLNKSANPREDKYIYI